MEVKEIMSKKVISISPNESAAVAARLLCRYNIGAIPVCATEGRVKGMVTDRDIVLRCVAAGEEPEATKVSEIMTRRVITVSSEDSVHTAMEKMAKEQIRRLPVEENGRLVGMLSLGDVAKIRSCTMEAADALSEISDNLKRM